MTVPGVAGRLYSAPKALSFAGFLESTANLPFRPTVQDLFAELVSVRNRRMRRKGGRSGVGSKALQATHAVYPCLKFSRFPAFTDETKLRFLLLFLTTTRVCRLGPHPLTFGCSYVSIHQSQDDPLLTGAIPLMTSAHPRPISLLPTCMVLSV